MYFSLYNNRYINTDKFFYKNLIKLPHFSCLVRTPPNKYIKNFIGELNHKSKPISEYDVISLPEDKTVSTKASRKRNKHSYSIRLGILPRVNANRTSYEFYKGGKCDKGIFSKKKYHIEKRKKFLNIDFPYSMPKIKLEKNILFTKKNKAEKVDISKYNNAKNVNRLYLTTISNFHKLINQIDKIN